MYASIRRFEGIDESRTAEITRTANEKLIPRLSELPGFSGYFLFEPANGVLTSISLFETCLLYTSPSPRDRQKSRMPSSA